MKYILENKTINCKNNIKKSLNLIGNSLMNDF